MEDQKSSRVAAWFCDRSYPKSSQPIIPASNNGRLNIEVLFQPYLGEERHSDIDPWACMLAAISISVDILLTDCDRTMLARQHFYTD